MLHPTLAAGQIEGGVAQGIGYALYERCEYKDGHLRNNQMTNYMMPTSADPPPIHVLFEETPSVHGAFGAKGVGELPMDGPAPVILKPVPLHRLHAHLEAVREAAALTHVKAAVACTRAKAPARMGSNAAAYDLIAPTTLEECWPPWPTVPMCRSLAAPKSWSPCARDAWHPSAW